MPIKVAKDLFGDDVQESEVSSEMSKSPKEEVIIIKGIEIPKEIYNLCILHYLGQQYGD